MNKRFSLSARLARCFSQSALAGLFISGIAAYAQVATPTLAPRAVGAYPVTQGIAVSCATPEATLYYTTNGNDPAQTDRTIVSGQTVTVNRPMTLKAKAFHATLGESAVAEGSYGIFGQVAGGAQHSLALTTDGTVWAWGYNYHGQLGDGTTTQSAIPVPIAGLTSVIAIAAGDDHSVVLKSDGTVWAWGNNSQGRLGDGTTTQRLAAVQVSGLSGVVEIAAGSDFTVAMKGDGTVWAWGDNSYGQLGDNTTTRRLTPVQVSGLTTAVEIAAGSEHALAVKADGTVVAWGYNIRGQLGNNTTTNAKVPVAVSNISSVVRVEAGNRHSAAVKSDGTVWCWGMNSNGQLGDGTTTDRKTPVQASGLTGVEAVTAGDNHTMAVTGSGAIWAWGRNDDGQLGLGSTTNKTTPQEVTALSGMVAVSGGATHSLAIKNDGTVWAWGINTKGQLGDATTTARTSPVQVHGPSAAPDSGWLHLISALLDSDGDGLPNWWELQYGFDPNDNGSINPNNGASGDPDGDGIDNITEYANQTDPLVAAGGGAGAGLRYDRWTITVPQSRYGMITDLTHTGALGRTPDQSADVTLAEAPISEGGEFGARLRGTVTAPATGNYQFAVSGSHVAELWLGDSASRYSKHRIAYVPNPVGSRDYTSYATQQMSAPIALVAGHKYYIEALNVGSWNGDHLSVAWKIVGQESGALLSELEVIDTQYLTKPVSDPTDLDDDCLPDAWESANGLNAQDGGASNPNNGEYGDPDSDLLSNFEEYQLGTNPMQATSITGRLQRQLWRDANVSLVREFRQNPRIVEIADIRDTTPGAEAPQSIPGNAAQRLRGWISAPVTGNYTLYIAGSRNCELWMGTNESKFSKVMVSQVIDRSGTEFHEWTRIAGQGSYPLSLVAGQRYYIEATQITRGWNDHMTLGWKRPDAGTDDPVEVVPAQFLSSFVKSAEDMEDDDLPDAWEAQYNLDTADNGSVNPDNGPLGDPDNDGVPNWMEYVAGTSPVNASTNGVTPDGTGMHGFLSRQIWNNIPTPLVAALTSSPQFVAAADVSDFVQMAESRYNAGPWFGERLRGRVIAPVSGEYTFWISGDNECELWLSPTASKFQRAKIAGAPKETWDITHFREWNKNPFQRSAPVTLVAGQEYYIEALHKQENDEDHLSVGWNLPGQNPDTDPPQVIPGSALRSYSPEADDLDDNGLADSWEQQFGINGMAYPDGGSYGDPDRDGVTNFEEYQIGSSPVVSGGFVGFLARQVWWDVGGVTAREFVQQPEFLQTADVWDLIEGAEAPQDFGNNDGQRLRGWITAPDSGVYTFHIAGSGSSELWLGTGESKFSKTFIAQVVLPTDPHEWSKYSDQTSAPVTLVAGQRYYVELLAKEHYGNASRHLTLGWKRPGAGTEDPVEVVPSQYLTSFGRSDDDLDDDDMPDAWEAQYGLSTTDNGSVNPDNGPFGDPDHDGIPNWLEYQAGTSPVNASTNTQTPDGGAAGVLSRQIWNSIPGATVSELTLSANFGGTPDVSDFVVSAESRYNAGPWFGERLRGRVIAPVSGEYTFWISGDNECELWLSPTASKFQRAKIAGAPKEASDITHFREWNKNPFQQSAPVTLVAGQEYYIEILHKQENDQDHVSVSWSYPGQDQQIIRGSALRSYVADADDVDDDGLPDSWERQVGLNPADNGFINPNEGSYGDPDADGFNNFAEYTNGTDPFSSQAIDTDGDGVSDYDEIHLYHTDPNSPDAIPPVKLADLALTSFQAPSGAWAMFPSGGLRSFTRRGAVDFPFSVNSAGIYLIEFKGAAYPANRYTPPVPVIARVDGVEIGRAEVLPFGSRHVWLSPNLAAGAHTLTIDNRNVRAGESLSIISLAVYEFPTGADANANGIRDWMETAFLSVDNVGTAAGASATSPVCFEGTARLPGDPTIAVAGRAGIIASQPGLAGHWYANVPLEESGDTAITASFENACLSKECSVTWVATNIFQAPDTLRVRVGDSLKFTAVPNGVDGQQTVAILTREGVSIARTGVPSGEGPALEPVIVLFDTAGTFTIAASAVTGQDTANDSIKIEVIDADFGPEFALEAGTPRIWDLPGVSRSLFIEGDLSLQEVGGAAQGSWRVLASYPEGRPGTPRVLARLWESGPIVATTTINAFSFEPSTVTGDVKLIDVLTDGTRVVEIRYVIDGPIPPGLSIWLQMYTDSLFANGTGWQELTAADFDANGEARVIFYKPPGDNSPRVCHFILPYFYNSIGSQVWQDVNRNGIQDDGEPGIANVSVELLDQILFTLVNRISAAEGFGTTTGRNKGQRSSASKAARSPDMLDPRF